MESDSTKSNFEDIEQELQKDSRRRLLLPIWMKVCCWIFMVLGAFAPIGLVAGVLDYNFELSLYGLSTYYPLSLYGLVIIALLSIKGLASYSLWFEKDWAINVAYVDAIIGIIVCIITMFGFQNSSRFTGVSFTFRVEIFLLLPYFYKLRKIKADWLAKL